MDGGTVRLSRNVRVEEDRLDLRREEKAPSVVEVVEGLDAEAVARAEELLCAAVPEGEAPHAVEALKAVLAPFFVGMEDDLGVAPAPEDVPSALERLRQLHVVVDLAVVGHPDRAVLVAHGLGAAFGEVDDAETPVGEGQRGGRIVSGRRPGMELRVTDAGRVEQDVALAVRPPVGDGVVHPHQGLHVHRRAVAMIDAYDSAQSLASSR